MTDTASPALNDTQRQQAKRVLSRFYWLNGIVVPCVLENVLLLWALQNGLGAAHTAVLSSFILLSMPMMFLGKRLSAAIGPVRAWSLAWFARYLFVLLMLPAPWMRSTPLEPLVPGLLTVCIFGLFAMRSMGMVNTVPVFGEVTTREDQGSFQAATSLRGHIAYFLTMAGIIALLHWRETPAVYQGILLFGSLVGIVSARLLRRLPELDRLRGSARQRIGTVTRQIRASLLLRRLALSWCAAFTATALIVPIAMLAIKRGYHVADDAALFLTLLELAGAILAAWLMSIVADHTGPRPILVLCMSLFWVTAGFWALAPEKFMPVAVGAVFLLGGIARHGMVLALNHYLLASTETRERIGVSLVMQMASGALSGLAGMLIAGGTIRWLAQNLYPDSGLALYRTYYRLVLLLLLPLTLVVWRLPKLKNWSVSNLIGLVFSVRDLRAMKTLNALRNDRSDEEDSMQIERLTLLASRHSEDVLRDFLDHGRLVQQARAIRALSRIPFGPDTTQALIRLVENGLYTNGWRAAELLGQRRLSAAIPALRQALLADDPFLRGKSMVALARLRDTPSYDAIRRFFEEAENPRIVIHGAQALEYLRQPDDLARVLQKLATREWPKPVHDEMLLASAGMLNRKAHVYRWLKTMRTQTDPSDMKPDVSLAGIPPVFQSVVDAFRRQNPQVVRSSAFILLLSA